MVLGNKDRISYLRIDAEKLKLFGERDLDFDLMTVACELDLQGLISVTYLCNKNEVNGSTHKHVQNLYQLALAEGKNKCLCSASHQGKLTLVDKNLYSKAMSKVIFAIVVSLYSSPTSTSLVAGTRYRNRNLTSVRRKRCHSSSPAQHNHGSHRHWKTWKKWESIFQSGKSQGIFSRLCHV